MAELLKKLSEINSVSGNEFAVRTLIISEIKKYVDKISIDNMGNIIALKKGSDSSFAALAAVNMDEAGFILSEITDKGYLKFKPVGCIDERKLVSKKVVIGESKVKGIIGMKAIHLQTKAERENTVLVNKLFIDIGAKDKKDAEKKVKTGDYITFDTEFAHIGKNVKGKALDRSGVCYALIQALRETYKNDVYACFLSQHEVGSRGAEVIGSRLKADAVLNVFAADTVDMYGCDGKSNGAALGKGVIVSFADKKLVSDKDITDRIIIAAKKANIQIQEGTLMYAASDGGAMQNGGGICMSAAIPCRYSHSPVSLMSIDDIDAAEKYISLFLNTAKDLVKR